MLKILQANLQQYVNQEFPDVQAGFRKGRGTRELPTFIGSWRKQGISRKISASLTTLKPLTGWITTNCGIFLKRWEYQTTLEPTVRTGHGTTDWFKIVKRVQHSCILSSCLFNVYAEYIMWNARVDDSQDGTKIAGRNINQLRYANDTS